MKITLLILSTLLFIACGSSSGGEHSSFRVSSISPLIDVNDTYLIKENTREAFQVKATDNSNLKYYISGKDAHLLYIDTITGELFFNEPTNYKKKSTYSFILIVEDSVGNRATKNITIKIEKGKKPLTLPTVDSPKRAFITVWKTDNIGVSNNNQITIPTLGNGYNYTVEWGDNKWKSMGGVFQNCSNMIINATDRPNLSHMTDMHRMFAYCDSVNQNLRNWDVRRVTSDAHKNFFTGAGEGNIEPHWRK